MVYVARFSNDIDKDIQRGWSGFFGSVGATVEEALESVGVYVDELDLEAAQSRWIRSYGSDYENIDVFTAEYLESLAEDKGLRFDQDLGEWRAFHHEGLSCWMLGAETDEDALKEAAEAAIEWAGFGAATIGSLRIVGKVTATGDSMKDDFLWVLECERCEGEV